MSPSRDLRWVLPAALSLSTASTAALAATNGPVTKEHFGYVDVCPMGERGRACDAKILTDEHGIPIHSMAGPVGGFSPADLEAAYGLPVDGGAGKIVAIFGGGSDYPNAESDLGVYRAQYGLPPCTTANGCFIKIDEHGGTNYPAAGSNEVEQSLDMEMVSAGCPACKVMLIEGGDLDVALATVIARGASAFSFSILFSYGSDSENGTQCESLGYNNLDAGLLITAAMGDNGYPSTSRWVPAACQGALAVGGTSLTTTSNARGYSETTWSGTGSGCGDAVDKPSWQHDPGCSMRMAGDVSAVADPYTGVAYYNTRGASGWGVIGGTSAATPLTAGALTALGIANGHFSPAWVWQNTENFYDITTGDNGTCADAGSAYICTAGPGYDGPTGWGTPNGALLRTALPPGETGDGGVCTPPTGSYSASCSNCTVGMRTTGCTLTCQSCGEVNGTENLGPTLRLPCATNVENSNGSLVCAAPPPPPPVPDAGAADASDGGKADAGKSADAGGVDATAPGAPDAAGWQDSGVGVIGSTPTGDAATSSGGANNDAGSGSGAGCGVSTGPSSGSSRLLLVAALFLAGAGRRRRARARGTSVERASEYAQRGPRERSKAGRFSPRLVPSRMRQLYAERRRNAGAVTDRALRPVARPVHAVRIESDRVRPPGIAMAKSRRASRARTLARRSGRFRRRCGPVRGPGNQKTSALTEVKWLRL